VRLTAIADSGHMIMYDQPQRFASVVEAFLLGR
jgi:pimeloyl-ACP methyl ester carboxylesterase